MDDPTSHDAVRQCAHEQTNENPTRRVDRSGNPSTLADIGVAKMDMPEDHFTRIAHQANRDRRLSHRARGILFYLLSHKDGWITSERHLAKNSGDDPDSNLEGRGAVRTALQELENLGYLTRTIVRDSKGKVAGTRYETRQFPIVDDDSSMVQKPMVGKSIHGPSDLGKSDQLRRTKKEDHSKEEQEKEEPDEEVTQNSDSIAKTAPTTSIVEKESDDSVNTEHEDEKLPHEAIRDAMRDYICIDDIATRLVQYTTREQRSRADFGTIAASLACFLGGRFTTQMLTQWAQYKLGELITREVEPRIWHKAIVNQGDLIAYFNDIEQRAARGSGTSMPATTMQTDEEANTFADILS